MYGGEQLEIGSGGDIEVAPKFCDHAVAHLEYSILHICTDVDDSELVLFWNLLDFSNGTGCGGSESLFGPGQEPVDGGAVD